MGARQEKLKKSAICSAAHMKSMIFALIFFFDK
jgi:hypothetical protein